MNPNPDYDSSDELEYGIAAYAWLLRATTRHSHMRRTWDPPTGSEPGCAAARSRQGKRD
jgi:hypothetical protein